MMFPFAHGATTQLGTKVSPTLCTPRLALRRSLKLPQASMHRSHESVVMVTRSSPTCSLLHDLVKESPYCAA